MFVSSIITSAKIGSSADLKFFWTGAMTDTAAADAETAPGATDNAMEDVVDAANGTAHAEGAEGTTAGGL